VHSDANFHNIVVGTDRVTLIDWDYPAVRYRLEELEGLEARLPPWVVRVASRVLRRIRQRGVTPAAAASSHRGLLGHVQPGPRSACGISSSAAGSTGSKSICSRPSRRSERNRLKGCPSPKQTVYRQRGHGAPAGWGAGTLC
jgi:hypothetical protein